MNGSQRVALVVPSLRLGGMERMVHELAVGLQARGVPVAVFLTESPGECAPDLERLGVNVVDCGASRPRITRVPARLTRRLARFRPDIIHAHSGSWLPATVAKVLLGRPRLVFTDHGRYLPEPGHRALLERLFLRSTSRLVAVSAELAEYLHGFLRLDAAPVVIPNGIDLEQHRRVPASARARLRAEWRVAETDTLAIAVGRLEPVKNHSGLLEAFARLAPRGHSLRLAILGTGRLEQQLTARASQLGVAERVLFLGHRRDVPECLAAADLFVSSSTSEGLPLSVLEALAAGLPILATAVGGIPAALGEPPAGVLVPPGDTAALAGALSDLAADAAMRARLGAAARERAAAFAIDTCVQAYRALYDDILEHTTGAPSTTPRARERSALEPV